MSAWQMHLLALAVQLVLFLVGIRSHRRIKAMAAEAVADRLEAVASHTRAVAAFESALAVRQSIVSAIAPAFTRTIQ